MGEPGKCYGCGRPSERITCGDCWASELDEGAAAVDTKQERLEKLRRSDLYCDDCHCIRHPDGPCRECDHAEPSPPSTSDFVRLEIVVGELSERTVISRAFYEKLTDSIAAQPFSLARLFEIGAVSAGAAFKLKAGKKATKKRARR